MDGRVKRVTARQRGLTLIELLVVLLIIALTASVVVLTAPPPRGKAADEADRFAARLSAAADKAVMTGTMIGLELSENDYAFYEYRRGAWNESEEAQLRPGVFSPDVSVSFEAPEIAIRNERAETQKRDEDLPAPNVFFTPTGETTSLEMTFTERREQRRLTLDNAGGLKVGEPGDED